MSVLIKGMEMPKSCFHCYFCDFGQCKLNPNITVIKNWLDKTLYKKCPLVDVPAPHGRLIDADKLKKNMRNYYPSIDHLCCSQHVVTKRDIECAPTIIEAEVSE